MKPAKSILDREFQYIPSTHTDVRLSWKRHGWRPKESAASSVNSSTAKINAPGPVQQCIHGWPIWMGCSDCATESAAPRVIPIKERK